MTTRALTDPGLHADWCRDAWHRCTCPLRGHSPQDIPAPGSCLHCGHAEYMHGFACRLPFTPPPSRVIRLRMEARAARRIADRADATHNPPPAPCGPRTAPDGAQPTTVHSAPTTTTLRSSEAVSREDTR